MTTRRPLATAIDATETPRGLRRHRTPIGVLEIGRKRGEGALTLTIAEGTRRGTHLDHESDGPAIRAAVREQRAATREIAEQYGLTRIEVYAPDSHGGCQVDEIDMLAE